MTGGDTALGLLEALGADGSEILSEVSVGIPMMRVIGGQAAGVKMVTEGRGLRHTGRNKQRLQEAEGDIIAQAN